MINILPILRDLPRLLTFAGALACLLTVPVPARAADTVLIEQGRPRIAVHVPPEVMAGDSKLPPNVAFVVRQTELSRQRLRESVLDLVATLKKMSGAEVAVLQRPATAGEKTVPVLVGEYARARFGEPAKRSAAKQGWRVIVAPAAVGLVGETHESTSYAVYEVLDRLGCRWVMPGELGEIVPSRRTVALAQGDISDVPDTEYRGVWYADEAFKRRNRLGGFLVSAGHALEGYISAQQREQHPEWRAIIGGKPHPTRLKWGLPAVSDAIAETIIARLDKDYTPSVSLSPDDGAEFDESTDKALDAGDMDPSMGTVSLTDRYVHLCNRIAAKVTQKYPDVRFGFLAYVQYTRPPVREKLHPSLIPQIAPITYCRAHAMTDAICPSRAQIRPIVEGWAKAAAGLSYYNYQFHLAETSVPYPMMRQMSEELPILYRNKVVFWQPETIPNFESALPGMWLSLRLAWDNSLKPGPVLDELFTAYYGSAQKPMRRYWQTMDDAWTNSSAHTGCGFGYLKRFPTSVLQEARAALNEAVAVAGSPLELRRIMMQDDSLRQFERFMQLRRDLAEGKLANLDVRATEWLGTQIGLGNEYAAGSAFNKVAWTPNTIAGTYFKGHYEKTYNEAARIAKSFTVLGGPLRQWQYRVDEKKEGEAARWFDPATSEPPGADWKTTDSAVDTWYDLGLEAFYGPVWYRAKPRLAAIPADKKVYLWVSATDGSLKVFVNGRHVPYVDAKGVSADVASGYATPFTFDVTDFVIPGAENQITLVGTRLFLNELGTGGLLGPAYLYRER